MRQNTSGVAQKISKVILAILLFWLSSIVFVPFIYATENCASQGGVCGNSVCVAPRSRQLTLTSDCSGIDENNDPLYCCTEPVSSTTPTCASQQGTCRRSCSSNETQVIATCPETGETRVCCTPPPCKPEGFEQADTTCGEWVQQPGNRCCEPLACKTWIRDHNTRSGVQCIKKEEIQAPITIQPEIPIKFVPQVSIPGSISVGGKTIEFKKCTTGTTNCGIDITGDTIGQYVKIFFQFFTAAIAVMAVVMVMWGGFKRIMAAGSSEKISAANEAIGGALTGLVLALLSYSLLGLINPALLTFQDLSSKVRPIQREDFTWEIDEELATPAPDSSLVPITTHDALYLDSDAKKYPYIREDTLRALRVAADKAKQAGIIIEVNYAARTLVEQNALHARNCLNEKCTPPTCDPRNNINNCPHTSGGAVDVTCKGKHSTDSCQDTLKKFMLDAGFCRLISEAWHFELPKMSSRCTITSSSS